MIMLTNSSVSHTGINAGDTSGENIDAVIRSNYIAAICAFASAAMLFFLGLFGLRKK
jgi:hypothetical protein